MTLVINLRGTNGSGKTTLVRRYLPDSLAGDATGGQVDLVRFPSPTKKDPDRQGTVEGYGRTDTSSIVVGSYRTACGGLDTIASFARQQAAIRSAIRVLDHALGKEAQDVTVFAEGILASTVFGSWAEFAEELHARDLERDEQHAFAFTYLHAPLDVCLERIRGRQEAAGRVREIKRELVADKVKAILATRTKAIAAGFLVFDLPYGGEVEALELIRLRRGEAFRAK